jgi:hypothetical protein
MSHAASRRAASLFEQIRESFEEDSKRIMDNSVAVMGSGLRSGYSKPPGKKQAFLSQIGDSDALHKLSMKRARILSGIFGNNDAVKLMSGIYDDISGINVYTASKQNKSKESRQGKGRVKRATKETKTSKMSKTGKRMKQSDDKPTHNIISSKVKDVVMGSNNETSKRSLRERAILAVQTVQRKQIVTEVWYNIFLTPYHVIILD